MDLIERLRSEATDWLYGGSTGEAADALQAQAAHIKLLEAAIVAMAEDGWLMHGVEGMSPEQQLCYDAYLTIKPAGNRKEGMANEKQI